MIKVSEVSHIAEIRYGKCVLYWKIFFHSFGCEWSHGVSEWCENGVLCKGKVEF